jgi:hypothetical protein
MPTLKNGSSLSSIKIGAPRGLEIGRKYRIGAPAVIVFCVCYWEAPRPQEAGSQGQVDGSYSAVAHHSPK